MSIIRDKKPTQGEPKDAVIGLVASIPALGFAVASIFFGSNMLIYAAIAFLIGVFEVRKGLVSEKKTLAKVAKFILVLAAIAVVVWAVTTVLGTFSKLFS